MMCGEKYEIIGYDTKYAVHATQCQSMANSETTIT